MLLEAGILSFPSSVPLTALSTYPVHTQRNFAVLHIYFNPENTHNVSGSKDSINYGTTKGCNHTKADKDDRSHQLWGGTKQKCLLAFHSCCFWRPGNPQETASQSRTLACHSMRMLFSVMQDEWEWADGETEKGPLEHFYIFRAS